MEDKYRLRSFMDGLDKKWVIEKIQVADRAISPYTYYIQIGGTFSADNKGLAVDALRTLQNFKQEIIE